jgi:hypothetical protein
MQKYDFKVYSFHPLEYRPRFYELINEEEAKGEFNYKIRVEETAPPPELIKDIILVTSASLNILWTLYKIYNEIKKKKGKVVIRMNGEDFDLEAYDIEELKVKMSKAKQKKNSEL